MVPVKFNGLSKTGLRNGYDWKYFSKGAVSYCRPTDIGIPCKWLSYLALLLTGIQPFRRWCSLAPPGSLKVVSKSLQSAVNDGGWHLSSHCSRPNDSGIWGTPVIFLNWCSGHAVWLVVVWWVSGRWHWKLSRALFLLSLSRGISLPVELLVVDKLRSREQHSVSCKRSLWLL